MSFHHGLVCRFDMAGKAPGILTTDETLARRYLSLHCTFIALGLDVTLLARAARDLAAKFKSTSEEAPANTAGAPY